MHASETTVIASLAALIDRLTQDEHTPASIVPGLSFYRYHGPTEPEAGLYEPCLCMVAQGCKQAQLGDETYTYDPQHYLISSVHLPAMFRVCKASPGKPYLGLTLSFDPLELARMLADSTLPPPTDTKTRRGMATAKADDALIGAVHRLVELVDHEQDIPVLAPLITTEILYRLLTGEVGGRLRQLAVRGGQGQHIAEAITWLNRNYTDPLKVDDLAARAEMSPSSFHHHFRQMTALSPLQYQKQLRLREARRLMLSEHIDASSAAFEVGYESPSQFSREYRRFFGSPPHRDITRIRSELDQERRPAAS